MRISDAIARAAARLEEPAITAIYPSAGIDTKAITFTHPEFLRRRDAPAKAAPNVFLYIDVRGPRELGFEDPEGYATISPVRSEQTSIGSFPALQQKLLFHSVRRRDGEEPLSDRSVVVIYVGASNRAIAEVATRERWTGDVFIGVCDGCRWGGVPPQECVNRLTLHGLTPAQAGTVPLPSWWITDHFNDAETYGSLNVGDHLRSLDPGFPATFRKVALLSTGWGTYGYGEVPGATLFEVCPVAASRRHAE